MARLNFDPRQVEPNQVFEPLPTSWYTGMIIDSQSKATSKNDGSFLELKVQVMGGDYDKRTVYDRLNLDNPNQQAVDIAFRTLSAICHAVGLGQQEVEDSSMLHGRPFLFKVSERPARTDPQTATRYEASNEIKGYKAIDPTAAPVLGPSKAQQRPFGAPPNMGQPTGPNFPGAGPQFAQPQQPVQQPAPPNGWGAQQPVQPQQQPQSFQQPQQFQPPQQQPVQPQPYQQPVMQPQQPWNQPQQQPPMQQPVQQQPVVNGQPPVQQQQPPQQQPVPNVGNPALAQGTPPPWAQPQVQPQGQNGQQPPWKQ